MADFIESKEDLAESVPQPKVKCLQKHDSSLVEVKNRLSRLSLETEQQNQEAVIALLDELSFPMKFVTSVWKDAIEANCIPNRAERQKGFNMILKTVSDEFMGAPEINITLGVPEEFGPLDVLEALILEINEAMERIIEHRDPEFSFAVAEYCSTLHAAEIRQSLFRLKKMKRMFN